MTTSTATTDNNEKRKQTRKGREIPAGQRTGLVCSFYFFYVCVSFVVVIEFLLSDRWFDSSFLILSSTWTWTLTWNIFYSFPPTRTLLFALKGFQQFFLNRYFVIWRQGLFQKFDETFLIYFYRI